MGPFPEHAEVMQIAISWAMTQPSCMAAKQVDEMLYNMNTCIWLNEPHCLPAQASYPHKKPHLLWRRDEALLPVLWSGPCCLLRNPHLCLGLALRGPLLLLAVALAAALYGALQLPSFLPRGPPVGLSYRLLLLAAAARGRALQVGVGFL